MQPEPPLVLIWIPLVALGILAILVARIRWWAALFVLPGSLYLAARPFAYLLDPQVQFDLRVFGKLGYAVVLYSGLAACGLFPLIVALRQRHGKVA